MAIVTYSYNTSFINNKKKTERLEDFREQNTWVSKDMWIFYR